MESHGLYRCPFVGVWEMELGAVGVTAWLRAESEHQATAYSSLSYSFGMAAQQQQKYYDTR